MVLVEKTKANMCHDLIFTFPDNAPGWLYSGERQKIRYPVDSEELGKKVWRLGLEVEMKNIHIKYHFDIRTFPK